MGQFTSAQYTPLVLAMVGVGFIFLAEMAYSYRREGLVKLGRIPTWLNAHILMGIIGPLVILWHTGGHFFGFPGVLAAFTVVVLLSGFSGRYLYRMIPRTIKGQELSLTELEEEARQLQERLAEERAASQEAESYYARLEAAAAGGVRPVSDAGELTWVELFFSELSWTKQRLALRAAARAKGGVHAGMAKRLSGLHMQRLAIRRRVSLLATTKTLLAKWKAVHVGMTLVLFAGIGIHVLSILYFGHSLP